MYTVHVRTHRVLNFIYSSPEWISITGMKRLEVCIGFNARLIKIS